MKGPGGRSTPCDAMDAAPGLLGTPPPEVLEDVLREQFGPLPQLAAICRLKRLPSGGYSSTEDLQLVLERRRVANAKERERVSALPRAGPQGHLGSTALRPRPGTGTNSSLLPPSPIPPSHARYPPQNTWSGSRAPIRRPPAGPGVDFGLLRAGSCSSLGE